MKNSLILGCVLISDLSFSQSTTHQSLYWIRYYNQTQLNPKYTLHIELDERRLINPERQFQLFVHAHLHRRFSKKIDVAAGFTFAGTNATKNPQLIVPELRPFQEINGSQQIGKKLQLQFRYRLDERFIHNNDKLELQDGYGFFVRHRFRIQSNLTLKKFENDRVIILKLSEEVMFNQGNGVSRAFDQNRIYVGSELQWNDKWATELGYLSLFQSSSEVDFFARDIIRLTVYHRLSLLSKE